MIWECIKVLKKSPYIKKPNMYQNFLQKNRGKKLNRFEKQKNRITKRNLEPKKKKKKKTQNR